VLYSDGLPIPRNHAPARTDPAPVAGGALLKSGKQKVESRNGGRIVVLAYNGKEAVKQGDRLFAIPLGQLLE